MPPTGIEADTVPQHHCASQPRLAMTRYLVSGVQIVFPGAVSGELGNEIHAITLPLRGPERQEPDPAFRFEHAAEVFDSPSPEKMPMISMTTNFVLKSFNKAIHSIRVRSAEKGIHAQPFHGAAGASHCLGHYVPVLVRVTRFRCFQGRKWIFKPQPRAAKYDCRRPTNGGCQAS